MNKFLILSPLSILCAFHTFADTNCDSLSEWKAAQAYLKGNQVKSVEIAYEARWWTQGQKPADYSGPWEVWKKLGACSGQPGNQPPQIKLTSPQNGSIYSVGETVMITADASDSDGQVQSVHFYLNGQEIHIDKDEPYAMSWQAELGDGYQFSAKAIDNQGTEAKSKTVRVHVTDGGNQPPRIAITSPKEGVRYDVGLMILAADATDPNQDIAEVRFYMNGTQIGTLYQPPYEWPWDATAGQHRMHIEVEDEEGRTAESPSVTFTVGDKPTDHAHCRPDGLYYSQDAQSPYCTVYDENGREKMGTDHPRRVIGYFTSWRHGKNGMPHYLVNQIPWDSLTHINYAFAHVDANNKVSIGDPNDPNNPATGMTWPDIPDAAMDPTYSFKGHFNLLNQFKKKHPGVKTLISVGGWAESGGFYTMTTNPDKSVNEQGIRTFVESSVAFIRQYGFDGVDIDYEYPTSMKDAGNPNDFDIANPIRGGLMRSYNVLMKSLREALDKAGQEDGKHYLLTIASPSSGYLLRGMEVFSAIKYLDYINIMTYDLHGAWNQFVGHNAALYDTGKDSELIAWNYYNTSQYGRIGYLNTDWAVHYFRGAVQAGRINIGVPYYSRGWRDVQGGENGLWGTAALPDQSKCLPGTGGSDTNKCGHGAIGIDNLWHDLDDNNQEMASGSNPLWHIQNLKSGKMGSYVERYGLDPANDPDDRITGTYTRFYDEVAVAPWLWNESKRVFLSIEDKESMHTKIQYVIDQGLGGIMFWELAGDYDWRVDQNEYFMGHTLTNQIYSAFKSASPYQHLRAEQPMPDKDLDIRFNIDGFKLGDQNYPINPKLHLTNYSGMVIPGGTEFQFDVPTAIPDNISNQSGFTLKVIKNGSNSAGNNIGGLENNLHRVSLKLPNWQSIPVGQSISVTLNYYLPMPEPSNWTVHMNGKSYGLKAEMRKLPQSAVMQSQIQQ